MKKIRQTNFYTIIASVYPKMLGLQRRSAEAALSIMPKKTFFNPEQRRCSYAVILTFLEYSDDVKLQRGSTAAVMNTTAL